MLSKPTAPGATEPALEELRDRGIGDPIRLDEVDSEDDNRGREDGKGRGGGARDQPQRDVRMEISEGVGGAAGDSDCSVVVSGMAGEVDSEVVGFEGCEGRVSSRVEIMCIRLWTWEVDWKAFGVSKETKWVV